MLGHAAFIVVDENGKATYQEFGRYPSSKDGSNDVRVIIANPNFASEGNIRQLQIGNRLEFDSDGNLTQKSLTTALDEVFGTSGLYKNADVGAASITQFALSKEQFGQLNTWLENQVKLVSDGITHYSVFDKNCMQFVYDAANAANLKISNFQDSPLFAVPSFGAANIQEVATTGFEYFSPGSWLGSSMTPVFGSDTKTANFLMDRLTQAAKAVSNWANITAGKVSEWVKDKVTGLVTGIDTTNDLGQLRHTSIAEDGTVTGVAFDRLGNKIREAHLKPNGIANEVSAFVNGVKTNEVKWTDDGQFSQRRFNGSGQKLSEVVIQRDGSEVETRYDLYNKEFWTQLTKGWDKDGKFIYESAVIDNGGSYETIFDKNTQAVLQDIETRVDGTQRKIVYDRDNKGDWSDVTLNTIRAGTSSRTIAILMMAPVINKNMIRKLGERPSALT